MPHDWPAMLHDAGPAYEYYIVRGCYVWRLQPKKWILPFGYQCKWRVRRLVLVVCSFVLLCAVDLSFQWHRFEIVAHGASLVGFFACLLHLWLFLTCLASALAARWRGGAVGPVRQVARYVDLSERERESAYEYS